MPGIRQRLEQRLLTEGVVESLIVSAAADVDNPPDGVTEVVSLIRSGSGAGAELAERPAIIVVRGPDIGPSAGPPKADPDPRLRRIGR